MRKRLKTKGDLGAQGLQESKGCGYTLDCGKRKDETWTLSAEPGLHIIASVSICQVRNKDCELNCLRVTLLGGEQGAECEEPLASYNRLCYIL